MASSRSDGQQDQDNLVEGKLAYVLIMFFIVLEVDSRNNNHYSGAFQLCDMLLDLLLKYWNFLF